MEEKGEEVVIAHGHMVDAEPVVDCLAENGLVAQETINPILARSQRDHGGHRTSKNVAPQGLRLRARGRTPQLRGGAEHECPGQVGQLHHLARLRGSAQEGAEEGEGEEKEVSAGTAEPRGRARSGAAGRRAERRECPCGFYLSLLYRCRQRCRHRCRQRCRKRSVLSTSLSTAMSTAMSTSLSTSMFFHRIRCRTLMHRQRCRVASSAVKAHFFKKNEQSFLYDLAWF